MGVSLIQHGSPPIGADPEGNPMGQENTLEDLQNLQIGKISLTYA